MDPMGLSIMWIFCIQITILIWECNGTIGYGYHMGYIGSVEFFHDLTSDSTGMSTCHQACTGSTASWSLNRHQIFWARSHYPGICSSWTIQCILFAFSQSANLCNNMLHCDVENWNLVKKKSVGLHNQVRHLKSETYNLHRVLEVGKGNIDTYPRSHWRKLSLLGRLRYVVSSPWHLLALRAANFRLRTEGAGANGGFLK